MLKVILIGSFLILATVSTCAAALRWDKREVDLRPEASTGEAKAEFTFENLTDHAVTITSINTSCQCTTAALEKETYTKGESGAIAATVKLGNWRGTKHKKIMVTTDDPTESTVVLTLTVHMPPATTQPTTRPARSTTQPVAVSETEQPSAK